MERKLEDPPAQRMRRFRQAGGGELIWVWDPEYIKQGYLRHWGAVACGGCKLNATGFTWQAANDHARNCYQIPE